MPPKMPPKRPAEMAAAGAVAAAGAAAAEALPAAEAAAAARGGVLAAAAWPDGLVWKRGERRGEAALEAGLPLPSASSVLWRRAPSEVDTSPPLTWGRPPCAPSVCGTTGAAAAMAVGAGGGLSMNFCFLSWSIEASSAADIA